MKRKCRVLIISAVVPIQRSGAGCLTMYRHFVVHDDFEIAVAANRDLQKTGFRFFRLQLDRLSERVRNTRFVRAVKNVEYIRNWWSRPPGLMKFAREFDPDIVFSVVDDWHMGLAWQVSRKLSVPLAVDFQDLFAVSKFIGRDARPSPFVAKYLLRRYRFLNRKAEIVFHVGEGMRDWFGEERRGRVLYPMANGELVRKDPNARRPGSALRILYTGNCRGAYGKMVLRFAKASLSVPELEFKIFSLGTDIEEIELARLESEGIYCGFLPFEELEAELKKADAFLLVMGFEQEERDFMETSFNTKWVDYVSYGKPIFVWAPEYSSASEFARKTGAGYPIDKNESACVVANILEVCRDSNAVAALKEGAQNAAKTALSPKRVQDVLVSALEPHSGKA